VSNQVVGASGQRAVPQRSSADLAADLERTRARLAGDVDQLRDYFAPASLARRGSERVTGWFLDDFGGVRPERVAAVVAPIVVLGAGIGVIRRWRRR